MGLMEVQGGGVGWWLGVEGQQDVRWETCIVINNNWHQTQTSYTDLSVDPSKNFLLKYDYQQNILGVL